MSDSGHAIRCRLEQSRLAQIGEQHMPKPDQTHMPPQVQSRLTMAYCPVCGHPAFAREVRHMPVLAGQVPRIERISIECPWCLTMTYKDPEKGIVTAGLSLDFAAQVRRGLTSGVLPEQIEAGGSAIVRGECDGAEHEAGSAEADEGGGA